MLALVVGCDRAAPRVRPEGFTIVEELRVGGVACRSTLEVAGPRMRAASCRADPPVVLLLDPAVGLTQLDPVRHEYRRVGTTGVAPPSAAIAAQPDAAAAGARFAAPQAQLIRQLIHDRPSPPLVPTAERRQVAGFPCRVHRRALGARPREELCIAAWADLPIRADDLAGFAALGPAAASDLPGLPLSSALYDDAGAELERTELVELRVGSIDPARLTIPADFHEASTPPARE